MKTVKVLFTGPECSGKSTLSHWAAEQFNGTYVPEFARLHLHNIGQNYGVHDLLFIANQQLKMESLAEKRGGYIFFDTSLLVVHIWMMEKFNFSLWDKGFSPKHLESFDHVLLCKPDIPWESDGMRENPTDRERLFKRYRSLLEEYAVSFQIIGGMTTHRQNKLLTLL